MIRTIETKAKIVKLVGHVVQRLANFIGVVF